MIRIATDSTGDLPPGCFEEYEIITVPINIQFGTDTYEDGVTKETFLADLTTSLVVHSGPGALGLVAYQI